ncbi:serine-type peptidase [Aureococcus anophagefferens]|nr:serine-type peptidase [Aureococcus anophagefferens]
MIGRFRRRVRLMQRLVRRWLGCLQARSDILMALWLRAECEIAADAAFHAADAPPGVALEDTVPERSRPRGLGTYLMAVLARHRRAGAAVRGSILPRGEDGLAPSQSILNVRRRLRKSKAKHALEQRKTHSRAHRAHQRRAGVESTISHHTHFWATLNRERRTIVAADLLEASAASAVRHAVEALLLAGPACGDAAMKAEVAALMGARRSAFFRRLEASRLAEGTATTQIFGRNEARRWLGGDEIAYAKRGSGYTIQLRSSEARAGQDKGDSMSLQRRAGDAPAPLRRRGAGRRRGARGEEGARDDGARRVRRRAQVPLSRIPRRGGHGRRRALRCAGDARATRTTRRRARRSASRTNIDEGGAIAEILAARGSPAAVLGEAPPPAAPDPRRPMPIESPRRRPVDPPEDDPDVTNLWACTLTELSETGVFCTASESTFDLNRDPPLPPDEIYDEVNAPMEYVHEEKVEEFSLAIDDHDDRGPPNFGAAKPPPPRAPLRSHDPKGALRRPSRAYAPVVGERTGAMLFWTVVVMSALVAIVLILRPVLLREARDSDTTKEYSTVGMSGFVDVGVLDAASASLAVDVSSVANPRVLATGSGCAVSYAINGTTLVIAGAANASRTPWLCGAGAEITYFVSPARVGDARSATVVVR